MKWRTCPKCQNYISTSWFVYSSIWEQYRCVNCSTFLKWTWLKAVLNLVSVAVFIVFFNFLFKDWDSRLAAAFVAIIIMIGLQYMAPSKNLVEIIADDKS